MTASTSTNLPLLQVRGMHAYYGQSHVLHGVDIQIHEGETVSLLGRNGAGKTTLLRSIMAAYVRREGEIRFRDVDLLSLPMYRIPRLGIGYVPEERGIFSSLSVSENLVLPPSFHKGGLSVEEVYRLFPNLKGRGNTSGTRLSGGEQQMLAIGRVLRTGARFILLDEPTEGLAPIVVEEIAAAIGELKRKGFTVLLVEQNFDVAAAVSDRFYVLEKGRVVDEMGSDELSSRRESLEQALGV
ncbi:ABC transporter ATP-binding protein [Cupriavidus necator]|uniref:ABC transporter ATP-binding protein n=1 Tax=Cupriavidus necator TaxID=106590 RepID=UPI0039C0F0A7